jgi:hypothetical protein
MRRRTGSAAVHFVAGAAGASVGAGVVGIGGVLVAVTLSDADGDSVGGGVVVTDGVSVSEALAVSPSVAVPAAAHSCSAMARSSNLLMARKSADASPREQQQHH